MMESQGPLPETGPCVATPFSMDSKKAKGGQVVGSASNTYPQARVLYEMPEELRRSNPS